jgi:hypothetical protein
MKFDSMNCSNDFKNDYVTWTSATILLHTTNSNAHDGRLPFISNINIRIINILTLHCNKRKEALQEKKLSNHTHWLVCHCFSFPIYRTWQN